MAVHSANELQEPAVDETSTYAWHIPKQHLSFYQLEYIIGRNRCFRSRLYLVGCRRAKFAESMFCWQLQLELKHSLDASVFAIGKHIVSLHAVVNGKMMSHKSVDFKFTVGDAIAQFFHEISG